MPTPHQRKIWRDSISNWLIQGRNEGPPFTEAQRARALGICKDQRLAPVAHRLENIESSGRIEIFLAYAITLPESFTYLKGKEPDFLKKEIEAVKTGADRFLSLMRKHQSLVEHYLSPPDEYGIEDYSQGELHFQKLGLLLRTICEQAKTGKHAVPPDCVPKLSRKKNMEAAEKRFCIKQLSITASKFFKKKLHKEIGILVSVILGLETIIGPDEVREIVRAN